ncbi:hypothetical protein ACQ1P6_03430 [Streptococcus pasteurianus]
MTYLIVAIAILSLAEVFTLTLLKRRNEDVRYYRSETYKDRIFTERAYSNSQKWSKANDTRGY